MREPRNIAIGVLRKMGERLSLDERAPYERQQHNETFDFDDPTNPNVCLSADNLRTDEYLAP